MYQIYISHMNYEINKLTQMYIMYTFDDNLIFYNLI